MISKYCLHIGLRLFYDLLQLDKFGYLNNLYTIQCILCAFFII